MYVPEWRNVCALTKNSFFVFIFKKSTKLTAEKAQGTRIHTLFNFLHDTQIRKWRRNRRRSSHTDTVSRSPWSHSSDDVTIDCWWRRNCDANTWKMICNSLDTDFICGDIHGWSCEKICQCYNCIFPGSLLRQIHQQPWYWLCRIGRHWCSARTNDTSFAGTAWRNGVHCRCIFIFVIYFFKAINNSVA